MQLIYVRQPDFPNSLLCGIRIGELNYHRSPSDEWVPSIPPAPDPAVSICSASMPWMVSHPSDNLTRNGTQGFAPECNELLKLTIMLSADRLGLTIWYLSGVRIAQHVPTCSVRQPPCPHVLLMDTLEEMGFHLSDPNIWTKRQGEDFEFIYVYADDLLVFSKDPMDLLDSLKARIKME